MVQLFVESFPGSALKQMVQSRLGFSDWRNYHTAAVHSTGKGNIEKADIFSQLLLVREDEVMLKIF